MACLRLLLAVCVGALAQPTEKLEFEVASIKPSPPPPAGQGFRVWCRGGPMRGPAGDPEMFMCENMSLANLVTTAYDVPYFRLSMPDWMNGGSPMFHLSAKVPPGTNEEQFRVMLQNLLADRFKLAVHRENRESSTYELVVSKNGPKFKDAVDLAPAATEEHRRKPGAIKTDKDGYAILDPVRGGAVFTNGRAHVHWPQATMSQLVDQISSQMRGHVTDATGLKGKYDIEIFWSTRPMRASADASDTDPGPTFVEALQQQLGLRLEANKGPVEFLVVDHAEKAPTEN